MKSAKLLSLQVLENYHATKLKPIVDIFIKQLTDSSNIQKFICNNTDRGMGFSLEQIITNDYIKHSTDYAVYIIWYKNSPLYVGEGYLAIRLGRFLKGLLGENRHDESHASDQLYMSIKKKNFDQKEILDNLYVSAMSITCANKYYDNLSLQHYLPLEGSNFHFKYEMEKLAEDGLLPTPYKPIGMYIEQRVMEELQPILNKNNMNLLSEERQLNLQKFIKSARI